MKIWYIFKSKNYEKILAQQEVYRMMYNVVA